ncbi:Uncharacterised protein [Mycolicibacterium vanbaalenii]|uniref:Uncharacterized protein n=1 Tax=Mycolicibacterium vanbaalenii TaxID=110539 RepID=A0A5S9R4R6_MYCVN|nr:hypothetical protein [Mycolicibacterium vanbaalenii]CAA0130015.1 Uncharacterised protein [Mycolicibacterium vanbaalenii]
MNTFRIAGRAAVALTAAVVGWSVPAQAAPGRPANAEDVINQLEDRGMRVVIDCQGPVGPLSEADIFSVRLNAGVVYVTVG